jgi:hypothetical protein
VDPREFKAVGMWGNLQLWKDFQSRYWNEILPQVSGGKLTAKAKPYTEVGLSGFEVMRLLKISAYDAVHAVTTNVAYGCADGRTLYITESATGNILTAPMPVAGRPMFSHI